MYMHEMLIDIMVMNFRNQLVVGEYMKAFRRAVLLRHANLFNQNRFRKEIAKLQVKPADFDNLADSLFKKPDGRDSDDDDDDVHSGIQNTPAAERKRLVYLTNGKDRNKRKRGGVLNQQLHT
jgi:hypothetical protein